MVPPVEQRARRRPTTELRTLSERIRAAPVLVRVLDAVPTMVMVTHPHRQIVYANRAAARTLELSDAAQLLGQRPGEALDCRNARRAPHGCGTAAACESCGALLSLLAAAEGRRQTGECRLVRHTDGAALDLRASAEPVDIEGRRLLILTLTDISHEKRRRALERIFLHDLLNTAAGITGYTDLLQDPAGGATAADVRDLRRFTDRLVEEIRYQRELLAAEHGELAVSLEEIDATTVITEAARLAEGLDAAHARRIEVAAPPVGTMAVESDPRLLRRVLLNMLKNALEAVRAGERVTIGAEPLGRGVRFWVHNPGTIPAAVQAQLFLRSFSTKGGGRGLGTYSMRLLTERYLGGRIGFTSSESEGTRFTADYPAGPPAAPAGEAPQ